MWVKSLQPWGWWLLKLMAGVTSSEVVKRHQSYRCEGWCMGIVESQPEPLIEHLGKGPGQPWEHRWRQFSWSEGVEPGCTSLRSHLRADCHGGRFFSWRSFFGEAFLLQAWNLLIQVGNLLSFLHSASLLCWSFCHCTFVVTPFLLYWSVQFLCTESQLLSCIGQISGIGKIAITEMNSYTQEIPDPFLNR